MTEVVSIDLACLEMHLAGPFRVPHLHVGVITNSRTGNRLPGPDACQPLLTGAGNGTHARIVVLDALTRFRPVANN